MAADQVGSGQRHAGRAKPLAGVRVLDVSRLAPGPYSTMLLADMGAEVIVVGGGTGSLPIPALARGKRFISLDLKSPEGHEAFVGLVKRSDVLVEGYRPGVMKRLRLDYETLREVNPRLIYCALTGYGQTGPLSQEAGHDLNYAAISGALGAFGPADGVPSFPLNLLADFAGGSLFATVGILSALYMRQHTGTGQYIDAAMVDGCMSLMAMHYPDWGQPVLRARGDGLLAGSAPFYRCYGCQDGRHIAVAALEPRFFDNLWAGMGYEDPVPDHMDRGAWPAMTERFAARFATRPRDEWARIFAGRDACVTPVLDPVEALSHPHNTARHPDLAPERVPVVPGLSGAASAPGEIALQDDTKRVLQDLGLWSEPLAAYAERSAAESGAGLKWPPL
ncbi:MAG: alpha-methylacyl-CoA racemase [Enterovirga sp.]|nr:alpha-methylacyl-CoA racemase [Enterovirga sp.]